MARCSPIRSCALALLAPLLASCTTLQTTYFRGSYIELTGADHPALQAAPATPRFAQVEDMKDKAHALYGEGYTMLGYSQFVSPLLPSLAGSYSTKWGRKVGAAYVGLETPRPGRSNLHYYLATYWGKLLPGVAPFGVYLDGLPEALLARIGAEQDMVVVWQVIDGTPAEAAARAAGGGRPRTAVPSVRKEANSIELWKKVYRDGQLAKWNRRNIQVIQENAPFILQNRYMYRRGPCRPYC